MAWLSDGRSHPGDGAQPQPRRPPLKTSHLQVGPPEEALLPGVAEDAWSPGARRGGSRCASAIPRSSGPSWRAGAGARGLAVPRGFGTRSATRWEVGWPRPATSSSSPSQPGAHSRVSLPPIPRLPRPACRGVPAAGGGACSNQSQAGNSSRGARRGCGSEVGPGTGPGNPPAPPPLGPPPASWKLGCGPTPALGATFLPLGAGGARKPSRPIQAGPQCPPPALGPAPPSPPPGRTRLLRGVGGRAGPATPELAPSVLGSSRAPAPAPPPRLLVTGRPLGGPGCALTAGADPSASGQAAAICPFHR